MAQLFTLGIIDMPGNIAPLSQIYAWTQLKSRMFYLLQWTLQSPSVYQYIIILTEQAPSKSFSLC